MLNEKDGWILSQLDFKGEQYSLLEKTYTYGTPGIHLPELDTNWSVDFQTGNDYTFFTYLTADTVPEPAALLLLGSGILVIRRRGR